MSEELIGGTPMLKREPYQVVCPGCHDTFTVQRLTARPVSVAKATDLREVYQEQERVLPHCVFLCTRCGFAGYATAFDDREIDVMTRVAMADALIWNIPWAENDAVERFHHALKCAEWNGDPAKDLGDLALNAAWCATEQRDTEAERYFRRRAVDFYETAWKQYDGVAPADRPAVTYIIGELYRRLEQYELASAWFTQAELEVTEDSAPSTQWVLRWAYVQRTEPKEYFV